jgi:ribosome-associated protein
MRGRDTLVLDLTGVTPIVDYFVVTTGASGRQMRAIAEEADRVLRKLGSRPFGTEGDEGSSWILHDFGDIVLHVFSPEARKLYDLEHLWADAPQVDWKSV